MLDFASWITDPQFTAHGSCIKTGSSPDRSRLVYLIRAEEAAYIRLNVVTAPDGSEIQLIDLVRGSADGTQWSATQRRAGDAVVTRGFASISDHAPVVGSLAGDGSDAQQLRAIAAAAIRLSCAES
jgi:hypothetical protein